jgi:hypothetical protein
MRYLFLLTCLVSFYYISAQSYAVTNVTVIPMDKERILPDQTVLIENGKIRQIGTSASIKIPSGATVINGTGKYLMPGLFDMHAHFFYEQGENVNTCEAELKLMLANGLTTVRIECGDPVYLEARKNVKEKKWIGPELLVTSPQFVGQWPWPGKVFAAICTTPQEAQEAVRRYKKDGYDAIKITFMVKKEVYDAIIKTAAEAGIKVTGHVGPDVKLPRALQAKQQIEHMDEFIEMLLPDTSYNHGQSVSDMGVWRRNSWATVDHLDESRIPALVKQVKQAGIYVTPTNYFFLSSFGEGMTEEKIRQRPDVEYIPGNIMRERWMIRDRYWNQPPTEERRKKYVHLRKKMTCELWKAGVPLMAGSDSPEWFLVQGFSIHDELATFVLAGLSPFAALQTATVNTAAYLGMDKKKATITQGKDADMILLNKNPLTDINNTRSIEAVFRNGIFYDRQQLDDMLKQAKKSMIPAASR